MCISKDPEWFKMKFLIKCFWKQDLTKYTHLILFQNILHFFFKKENPIFFITCGPHSPPSPRLWTCPQLIGFFYAFPYALCIILSASSFDPTTRRTSRTKPKWSSTKKVRATQIFNKYKKTEIVDILCCFLEKRILGLGVAIYPQIIRNQRNRHNGT